MTLQECVDIIDNRLDRQAKRIDNASDYIKTLQENTDKIHGELLERIHQLELAKVELLAKLDFLNTYLLAGYKPYQSPTQPNPQDTQWTVNSTNPGSPSA